MAATMLVMDVAAAFAEVGFKLAVTAYLGSTVVIVAGHLLGW